MISFCYALQLCFELAQTVRLRARLQPLGFRYSVLLAPQTEALGRHLESLGHVGHPIAIFGDMLDRTDLQLFRVSLAVNNTSR